MARDDEMGEFMNHDVIQNLRRCHHALPVKVEIPFRGP